MANDVTTDSLSEITYKVTCGVYRKKDGKYGVIPWLEDTSGKFVRFAVKDPKDLEKDYNWWTLERIRNPMFGFFCWKMLKQKDGWERINQFKPN